MANREHLAKIAKMEDDIEAWTGPGRVIRHWRLMVPSDTVQHFPLSHPR